MEKYNTYTVSDFIEDSGFIGFIKYGRNAEDWRGWMELEPPSRPAFEEASIYLRTILNAERIRPAAAVADVVLNQIRAGIIRQEKEGRVSRMVRSGAVAAACLTVLFAAGWYYYTDKITMTTGYAQQKQVELPDHSIVNLNANSSITWYRAWKWRKSREVWVKGEGLFKVEHHSGNTTIPVPVAERFTAHVGNLSVQVLGTVFNIRQRRTMISIALLEGKISVTDEQHIAGKPLNTALILHPGEAVNYDDTTIRLSRIVKLPNQPQAWVDHQIQANGMTVQDIIDNYEDTYGHRIILVNPAQANKRIDGTISLQTEEGVLYTLANILNANIERRDSLIYLRPK